MTPVRVNMPGSGEDSFLDLQTRTGVERRCLDMSRTGTEGRARA
jgi:hypothetical protein